MSIGSIIKKYINKVKLVLGSHIKWVTGSNGNIGEMFISDPMLSPKIRQQHLRLLIGTTSVGLLVYCAYFGNILVRPIMAWRSSGSSNANLIENLHSKCFIFS